MIRVFSIFGLLSPQNVEFLLGIIQLISRGRELVCIKSNFLSTSTGAAD